MQTLDDVNRAEFTANSNLIIDQERGIVTHSKVLNMENYRKYQGLPDTRFRPDLNERQAILYFQKYKIAESYLYHLRFELLSEIKRLGTQASFTYMLENCWPYFNQYFMMDYPVIQRIETGRVYRSRFEANNLVKIIDSILKRSKQYGMAQRSRPIDQQLVQKLAHKLTQRVLANLEEL